MATGFSSLLLMMSARSVSVEADVEGIFCLIKILVLAYLVFDQVAS